MKRDLKKYISAGIAAILLVSISGVALAFYGQYSGSVQTTGDVTVQIVNHADSAEGESVLAPEQPVLSAPSVRNTGDNTCYLRVKLEIPQVNGIPIFRVGIIHNSLFEEGVYTAERSGNDTAYWEQVDGYYYYRNTKTGNCLRPDDETPVIYEAVALNADLPSQQLRFTDGQEQTVIVYAEAVEANLDEETAWKRIPAVQS